MVRDRTTEFVATVKSMAGRPQFYTTNGNIGGLGPMELRARKSAVSNGSKQLSPLLNPSSSQYNQFARFMGGSRSIARDLYLTYQKLEKINLLAQKKTIFDDEESSKELNELVYIVKQDITSLNQQIESLRQLQLESQNSSTANSNSGNVRSHTKNVVLTLQQQLASISSSFKSTLELRTQVRLNYIDLIELFIYLFSNRTCENRNNVGNSSQMPPRSTLHSYLVGQVVELVDHYHIPVQHQHYLVRL